MSQQEFMPESQYNTARSQEKQESYAQSAYSWSRKRKATERLKNEHPSTFEEAIPPYNYQAGYQAQGQVVAGATSTRQQTSANGNAARNNSRSYTQQAGRHQIPYWAAPPRINKRSLWFWTGIALLVIGLIGMIPALVVIGVTVVGIVVLAILIPIFIFLAILFILAVIALSVLMFLGVPLRVGPFRVGGNRWRRW